MCDMRIAKIASALLMTGVLALSQRMMGQVFPLHTSGAHIVDANGVRVRLNGVNWYGAEGTDYVVTGLQYNTLPKIARLIKQQGYNVVRLPWSNQLYESNPVVSSTVLTANPGLQGLTALQIMDQVINALGQRASWLSSTIMRVRQVSAAEAMQISFGITPHIPNLVGLAIGEGWPQDIRGIPG